MKININHLSPEAQDHIYDGFIRGIEVYREFLTLTEIVEAIVLEHRLLISKLDSILEGVVDKQNDDDMRHVTADDQSTFRAFVRATWNAVAKRCFSFTRPRTA